MKHQGNCENYTDNLFIYTPQQVLLGLHIGYTATMAGIKIHYGLDEPGNKSQWRQDFSCGTDHPQGLSSLPRNEYRVSPGR